MDLFNNNPGIVLTILIIILLLVIIAILLRSMHHRKIFEQELRVKDERIRIALSRTNILVGDYDLEKDRLTFMEGSKKWGKVRDFDNASQTLPECGFFVDGYSDTVRRMINEVRGGAEKISDLLLVKKIKPEGGLLEDTMWLEVKVSGIAGNNGKIIRAIILAEDVTPKITHELNLKEQASRDPLTNLLNRTSFRSSVEEFLEKGYKKDMCSALIMIDTDDFKSANDIYGHYYGDQVLRGIGEKLKNLMRCDDLVGRLGGDEFVIFMKNVRNIEVIEEKAKAICSALVFTKGDLITTCSVGVAIVGEEKVDYDILYQCADGAMYQAKKMGKKKYIINET